MQRSTRAVAETSPSALSLSTADGRELDLPLDRIDRSPFQERKMFDEQELRELADTIREHGVLQRITVREKPDGRYELVFGERRVRAAQLAGLARIPASVRTLSDAEAATLTAIENLQRADLRPMEEARQLQRLKEVGDLSVVEIARRLGKTAAYVQVRLDALTLPPTVQAMLDDRRLFLAHVPVLKQVDVSYQVEAATMAAKQKLTVAQLTARTQHRRTGSAPFTSGTMRSGPTELQRQLVQLYAILESFQPDAHLPSVTRETLAKQLGVLADALQRVKQQLTASTHAAPRSPSDTL